MKQQILDQLNELSQREIALLAYILSGMQTTELTGIDPRKNLEERLNFHRWQSQLINDILAGIRAPNFESQDGIPLDAACVVPVNVIVRP